MRLKIVLSSLMFVGMLSVSATVAPASAMVVRNNAIPVATPTQVHKCQTGYGC
jgi:hypothetical protein